MSLREIKFQEQETEGVPENLDDKLSDVAIEMQKDPLLNPIIQTAFRGDQISESCFESLKKQQNAYMIGHRCVIKKLTKESEYVISKIEKQIKS